MSLFNYLCIAVVRHLCMYLCIALLFVISLSLYFVSTSFLSCVFDVCVYVLSS